MHNDVWASVCPSMVMTISIKVPEYSVLSHHDPRPNRTLWLRLAEKLRVARSKVSPAAELLDAALQDRLSCSTSGASAMAGCNVFPLLGRLS